MNCSECGKELKIGDFPFCPHAPFRQFEVAVHPSERAVVWHHEGTNEVCYPGRNDVAMPERYKNAGFTRKELPTLRDVERLERDHKVRSEMAWFDRGSGRSFDGG